MIATTSQHKNRVPAEVRAAIMGLRSWIETLKKSAVEQRDNPDRVALHKKAISDARRQIDQLSK